MPEVVEEQRRIPPDEDENDPVRMKKKIICTSFPDIDVFFPHLVFFFLTSCIYSLDFTVKPLGPRIIFNINRNEVNTQKGRKPLEK